MMVGRIDAYARPFSGLKEAEVYKRLLQPAFNAKPRRAPHLSPPPAAALVLAIPHADECETSRFRNTQKLAVYNLATC